MKLLLKFNLIVIALVAIGLAIVSWVAHSFLIDNGRAHDRQRLPRSTFHADRSGPLRNRPLTYPQCPPRTSATGQRTDHHRLVR
jgi:hypothetical protein